MAAGAELFLPDELVQALLGALLAVCRADGDATRAELAALRTFGGRLGGDEAAVVERDLFFSAVTPRTLAETWARASRGGPFRGRAVSPARAVAAAFARTAVQVARADGPLNEAEIRAISGFARALGASEDELRGVDPALDERLLDG